MRETWIAAVLAIGLAVASPDGLAAQDRVPPELVDRGGPVSADVRAGVAVPISDLSDLTGAGPTFGASLRYRVHSRVGLRLDGEVDLLTGLDADGNRSATPDVELWRALAGVDVRVLPAGSPLRLTAHVTGGLTSFNTAVFPDIVFEPGTGDPVGDFAETYPTASGGLEAGYGVAPSVEVFARGAWTVMLTDEDDTSIFSEIRSGTGGFDRAGTVPVTVGLRLRI